MNVFQLDYYTRLRAWSELRESLHDKPIEEVCTRIDEFWQQTPMSNHYLHPADIATTWPDPWLLLEDNIYCPYARALGMAYTLLMLGHTDIVMIDAIDYNSVSVVLVVVDDAKYVMNYWPGTIINNKLNDFTIVKRHDISPLKTKIGSI